MVFSNNLLLGAVSAAAGDYLIEQSLLFNDGDSAYLNRTPSVAGNRKTWTFSAWIKRGTISTTQGLLVAVQGANMGLYIGSDNKLALYTYYSGGWGGLAYSNSVLRDTSSWYHIVHSVDSTNPVAADRVKLYINGVRDTLSVSSNLTLNADTAINDTIVHGLGANPTPNGYFDGLMALPILVDGAAVDAVSFGETDDDGFWNPIEFDATAITDAAPTVTFIGTNTDNTNNNSVYTFSSESIGTANANRQVILAINGKRSAGAGLAINSCTIGGVTARVLVEEDSIDAQLSAFVIANVPSGTTGDIVITFNSNSETCAIGVYTTVIENPVVWATAQDSGSTTLVSATLNTPTSNGFALACVTQTDSGNDASCVFTGVTEDADLSYDTSQGFAIGSATVSAGSLAISGVINTNGNNNRALSCIHVSGRYGFGPNGFQLDYADTTFFGKNVSGTDDQSALSSAAPAATAWLNITGAWTMGSGTASRTSTVNAIRSASVFTGDFSLALTMASGANAARVGVYAANEDGTFASSGAGGGMDSMTNSFYANFGAASFYKGSSTTASVSQTNGAITITRVSGTITINTAGGNHTFSATYTGPMRFVLAGGGATMSFTGIAYTADGQAGNSYFDTNFVASDQLEDTPTDSSDDGIGNFSTLNPNFKQGTSALSEGNLKIASSSGFGGFAGTVGMDSGKYYWEQSHVGTVAGNFNMGVCRAGVGTSTSITGNAFVAVYEAANNFRANGSNLGNFTPSVTTDCIIGWAYDADARELWMAVDNTFVNLASAGTGNPATGANPTATISGTDSVFPIGQIYNASGSKYAEYNFGQKPFDYTPPTGFVALATQEFPTPTIADGSQYFNTVLYTGTGSELAITSLDFTPDFVWIKNRDATDNHMLYDSVRGATKDLHSNTADAETTTAQTLKSFDSAGFTLGTDVQVNTNTEDYVAWCWKAGGAAASNTDGTITSSVSANTTSGFSIVSYTGSGTASDTVGHGLSTIPSLIIARNRTESGSWCVTHESLSADKVLRFEGNNAEGDIADGELDSPPNNSSTFGFNNGTSGTPLKAVNASSIPYIAYCWSEVEGFSKFGSYTGNGSTDGPFVYTGFRPAFVMTKRTNSTGEWRMQDTARVPYNPFTGYLRASTSEAELSGGAFDFLSKRL